jgi:hypothetical protein
LRVAGTVRNRLRERDVLPPHRSNVLAGRETLPFGKEFLPMLNPGFPRLDALIREASSAMDRA